MAFKVTEVIDGDTFDVTPEWKFNEESGDRVRIADLDAPELNQPGGQDAKDELTSLIKGKDVELKNAVNISYGRLVCDVYYNGADIKTSLSYA